MTFIQKMFEKQIDKIMLEVDNLTEEHIAFCEEKQKSTKIADIVNDKLDDKIAKRLGYLMTKIAIINMLTSQLSIKE